VHHQYIESSRRVRNTAFQFSPEIRNRQAMRKSMNTNRPNVEPFKPSDGGHVQIPDPAKHFNRRANVRLPGGVMISGNNNCGNSILGRQAMQQLGSPRHDAVERTNGMKQVTRMNAKVRFNSDDLVDRLAKTANNVFLTLRQAGRGATAMTLAGSEVAV
jgi:hypothetical protein